MKPSITKIVVQKMYWQLYDEVNLQMNEQVRLQVSEQVYWQVFDQTSRHVYVQMFLNTTKQSRGD